MSITATTLNMYISLAYLNVRRALKGIVSEWDDLGEVLGLPHHEVKHIKANCPRDVKECLKEVIEKWLEGRGSGLHPSWKSLCQALRDPLVARPDLASSIEQTYLSMGSVRPKT